MLRREIEDRNFNFLTKHNMQSFQYMKRLDDLSPFFQTLKRSKNVRKGPQLTISINLVKWILLNELLNICIYCIDVFSCEGF